MIRTMNIARLLLLCGHFLFAASRLKLVHADSVVFIRTGTQELRKLEGNVYLKQDSAFLRCQRAFFYPNTDRAELFDAVQIYDGRHHLNADRIFYEGKTKIERAFGNVRLKSKSQILTSKSLVYRQAEGHATAAGDARIHDLIEGVILTGQQIRYDRERGYGIATGHPEALLADTASADTLRIGGLKIEGWREAQNVMVTDSVSLQRGEWRAFCSNAMYQSEKEQLTLAGEPVLYELDREIRGDTIHIHLEKTRFKSGFVQGHVIAISQDSLYQDIIKGREMQIVTDDDSSRTVTINQQAQSTYHVYNDHGQYEGFNTISGDQIVLKFSGKKLTYVKVSSAPGESQGKFIPEKQKRKAGTS